MVWSDNTFSRLHNQTCFNNVHLDESTLLIGNVLLTNKESDPEWKALEASELNLIAIIPSPKSYPRKQ